MIAEIGGRSSCRTLRLAAAYERLGYVLDGTGGLRPLVLDNLTGTALTEALRAYVTRINLNPDDAALQVGSAKDLDEASARHVLLELTGEYPTAGHASSFPVTLARAFTALGLAPPPSVQLDPDPHRAVQQSMFLLGVAVNRLRNQVGTGHGRPDASSKTAPLTPAESRLVARASALLVGLLLDTLDHS